MINLISKRTRLFAPIFALALVAGFAALTLAPRAGPVSADDGRHHRSADVTFTKWVTAFPGVGVVADMKGVVDGDVGKGTFTGEVLSMDSLTVPHMDLVYALYHFNGKTHNFTADLSVTQTTGVGAVIAGRITSGWLKGALVKGDYVVLTTCDIPTPGNVYGPQGLCFKGTLHISGGSDD